jgi:cytochrome c biogenesis protein CcmG, thiol:disulfide interchange protein DsbE
MKKIVLWLPLGIFFAIFAFFAAGLINPSDRTIMSGMIGRPVPLFDLAGVPGKNADMKTAEFGDGKPRLLNIFASWCVPCKVEAPALMQLKLNGVEIYGVAIHDTPENLQKFLNESGDPYTKIGLDPNSRTQIQFGSAGVPETFVVNGAGKIVHQHVGIITANDVPIIAAKLRSAQ